MNEDKGHHQHDLNNYGQVVSIPCRNTYPLWPKFYGTLPPDSDSPGPSGYYPYPYGRVPEHFTAARATALLPRNISRPEAPRSSLSESSPPAPPFTSSPDASFSSDTSAATHHASTTSISEDRSHDFFSFQMTQHPSGSPGVRFQLDSGKQNVHRTAAVTESGESIVDLADESMAPACEDLRLRLSLSAEGSDLYDTSRPQFFCDQAPRPNRTALRLVTDPHRTTTDAPVGSGPHPLTPPNQTDSVEPILGPLSLISQGSSSRPTIHNDPSVVPSSEGQLHSGFPANPLASALTRDALLMYAHRIYDSLASPLPSGLSPVPDNSPSMDPTSPDHPYTTQLLPLLLSLRRLHPQHLPTLLLFSCVLYAAGHLNQSLAVNSQILHIDPNYVGPLV